MIPLTASHLPILGYLNGAMVHPSKLSLSNDHKLHHLMGLFYCTNTTVHFCSFSCSVMAHDTVLTLLNDVVLVSSGLAADGDTYAASVYGWSNEWLQQYLNGDRPYFTDFECRSIYRTDKALNKILHHVCGLQDQLNLTVS